MRFFEYNSWWWDLPNYFHDLAFTILMAAYMHMTYGFFLYWSRLRFPVKAYFLLRTAIYLFYIMAKSEDSQLGMMDLFFPIYILAYIDGLIILNGAGFYRCREIIKAFIKIFKFK
ncbi:hypothetical protein JM79_3225 [Gramella sp. Hel_I_59]|uniref:hypothetical protein n=1 Tax=Gramella sp. Hel_I_59 TaxID=1249978 RepID=UPI001154ED46|nr:hypothetical protein [Gramella sp. Hel_I_59]TQI72268.1 hypothetical protein JM79_3225 [Gramella sp. Hel_I_59]